MKSRADMDWSKHILTTEKHGDFATVHRLKKPNTGWEMVEFINIKGHGLLVCGDFGDWKFSRCFIPDRKNHVSDYFWMVSESYWIEKLKISNENIDPFVFSKKILLEEIKNLEELYLEEDDVLNKTEREEFNTWIDELRDCDSTEVLMSLCEDAPGFIDGEDFPEGKDVCEWLKIVFDAFDEICRRMKPCCRQEKCRSKKINELGVCSWYREKDKSCQHPDYERILDWSNQ